MKKDSKIYLAGHQGLVGSAIWRLLKQTGHDNLIGYTKEEVNLFDIEETFQMFMRVKPEYVFLSAAVVGGIEANASDQSTFLFANNAIQQNVIGSARHVGVNKLLFLGSSCIYPRDCPQPIKEEYLLSGPLEKTNEGYALAKICGLKLCEYYRKDYGANFISAMPTNLYGPGDNFDPNTSHVIPGIMAKMHQAADRNEPFVTLWGTGAPLREFLYVDDLAEACVFLMQNYDQPEPINVGYGSDITIKELADKIARVVGFTGEIRWDTGKPDGTPRKLLDSSKILNMGWAPKTTLDDGLKKTYSAYIASLNRN